MRYAVIALVATLLAAGCTGMGPKGVTYQEVARLPASDAVGLTRQELEARLRLSPAKRLGLREARLEGDVVVTHVRAFMLAHETRCASGRFPDVNLEQPDGKKFPDPEFVFRADRVEAVILRRVRDVVPAAGDVTATCMSASNDQSRAFAETIVMAPLLLPVAGVFGAVNAVTAKDVNGPLSKLPLGGEAPGGLDAYLANLPDGAVVAGREAMNARVDFHFLKDSDYWRHAPAASVHFVDGRVAKLTSISIPGCVLTNGLTFSCDRGSP